MAIRNGTVTVEGPNTTHQICRDGALFVTTTATIDSALATDVKTAYDGTHPLLKIYNSDTVGATLAKQIELYRIKLICTVADASGTTVNYAGVLDQSFRTPSVNHVTRLTPVNTNTNYNTPSVAQIDMQNSATATTIPAATSAARTACRGSMGGIMIVGDEIVIEFGGPDVGYSAGLTAAEATTPGHKSSSAPAVIIAPGWSFTLYTWYANNASTAPSFELEMQHFERDQYAA